MCILWMSTKQSCITCVTRTHAYTHIHAYKHTNTYIRDYSRLVKVEVLLRPTISRPVCRVVKNPFWGPRPEFYYCHTVAGSLMWGAFSDERTGLSFFGLHQHSHSRVRLLRDFITTFYCLRFETPPTWRARSPYLYHPGTGWPSYTPKFKNG
jgi:hypothetical protein